MTSPNSSSTPVGHVFNPTPISFAPPRTEAFIDTEAKRPHWLPEEWKIEVHVRDSGRKDKFYINLLTGKKLRSLVEVSRELGLSAPKPKTSKAKAGHLGESSSNKKRKADKEKSANNEHGKDGEKDGEQKGVEESATLPE